MNTSLPSRTKVKTCWGCRFSYAEEGGPHGNTVVYCKKRYEGHPKTEIEFVDIVTHNEVCPLWEECVGKMPVYLLVAGGREDERVRLK